MTREETQTVLRIVRAEWPASFRNMSRQDAEDKLNLWAELFADDDAKLVAAALKAIIVAENREFAPQIGTIKEQMRKLTAPDEMSEAEAWARIRKAIRNADYEPVKEYKKLPEVLKKLVGSPSQLHEWAMMDSETLNSVVASNVQRAYRTVQARESERAKLPESVKTAIAEMAQRFAMPEAKQLSLPDGGESA